MGDLAGVIIGGVIGIAGSLIKDYSTRKWDKEKWLLDHEAKECAECIDLLWASRPPESTVDLKVNGWNSADFNGRMDSLRRVPAKMASLMLYQAHRGESTIRFEESREFLVQQIDAVRAEVDRVEGEEKFKSPHELPRAIDAALKTVEDYLKAVKKQRESRKDNWSNWLREKVCG
jgi:hypothetical protein